MKYRTTIKSIREGCNNICYVGYCDLYHLLHNHEPNAYTCGVYGWNFDVYEVYGLTICTGYRGMPGKRLNWQQVEEYEKKAKSIWSWDDKRPFEEKQEAVENLLKEFCVMNGGVA